MATSKKTRTTKTAVKKARSTSKTSKGKATSGKINNVSIRMYCLGTGDCFVIKFCDGANPQFTMMIDCGSCQGTPQTFAPYISDLATYVGNHIDLLVITHEHNDHVNGFAKCEGVFKDKNLKIDEAWFAWTENPDDPDGRAKKLQEKRKKMRNALTSAINKFKVEANNFKQAKSDDYYKMKVEESNAAFLQGLDTLADINLADNGMTGAPLPGMLKIKAILKTKKGANGKNTRISYLAPGQSVTMDKLDGFKFHILGPPYERDYIFKDGKEGIDVYKKKLNFYESALALNSFLHDESVDQDGRDIPFNESYIAVNDPKDDLQRSVMSKIRRQSVVVDSHSTSVRDEYEKEGNEWRKIDTEWLTSAGALALRLNSHINNTSLAMAIEHVDSGKVILLPGDAEYGSWESWHAINEWKKKGKGGVPFAQDLLGRTIFYKVGHHLSYNGTALKLGIEMMPTSGLTAMATLDLNRIAKGWKSTMPNKFLLQELIKRCEGKLFIMDEKGISNPPSATLEPTDLGPAIYETRPLPGNKKQPMFKQYTVKL